jgi:uncharacterized protein YndB with AHSA1/START domain
LTPPSALRTIRQTFELLATPRQVYDAISTPSALNRWFTDAATIEARAGGMYRFSWKGGYVHEGRVVAATRAKLLVLEWPQDGLETQVSFKLRSSRPGTILQFEQSGVGLDVQRLEIFLGIYTGWTYYLTNLRALLETDRDLRRPRDRYW